MTGHALLKVLLALALLGGWGCKGNDTTPPAGGVNPPATTVDPPPYFSEFPMAEAEYSGIVPLGNLNPTSHIFPSDHLYIYLRLEEGGGTLQIPLVAPGEIIVTNVESVEHVTAGFTDYGLGFTVPKNRYFSGRFVHMKSLSSVLADALTGVTPNCDTYSTGGETYTMCWYQTNIEMAAGEELGSIGGRAGLWALDFFAYDRSLPPSPYANPARYDGYEVPYAVCAIDYYEEPLRSALESRLGDYSGSVRRTVEPICGEVNQDLPGTAQGNWFRQGFPDLYPEDNHLALVHHNVDPTIPVFSVGTQALTLNGGAYRYTPKASGLVNRDFADITADGQTYCFETPFLPGNIILIHLPDDNTLHLESQSSTSCGSGPWSFTEAMAIYQR